MTDQWTDQPTKPTDRPTNQPTDQRYTEVTLPLRIINGIPLVVVIINSISTRQREQKSNLSMQVKQ